MSGAMPENMRVLRFFAANKADIDAVAAQSGENSGVKVQSMVRGSETLVLLEAVTKSGPATRAALSAWQDKFANATQGAFYATGDATLAEVTMKALQEEKLIFACADVKTGEWVCEKLKGFLQAKKVFDFGEHSYLHTKIMQKIKEGSRFARKYSNDTAQQIAGQVKATYKYSGADYTVSVYNENDETSYVFVGDKSGFWFRKVPKDQSGYLWAMDILRRLALDLQQVKGTVYLKYGEKIPATLQSKTVVSNINAEQDVWGENTFESEVEDSEIDEQIVPTEKSSSMRYIFAVLWVALFATIALGIAYLYTGGDIASLWESFMLEPFSGSSASML